MQLFLLKLEILIRRRKEIASHLCVFKSLDRVDVLEQDRENEISSISEVTKWSRI